MNNKGIVGWAVVGVVAVVIAVAGVANHYVFHFAGFPK